MPGASPLAASDGGAGLALAGGAARRRMGLELVERERRLARFAAFRRVLMKAVDAW
jgi:hypothetical protein